MYPNFEMGGLCFKKDVNLPEIPPLDLSKFPDYAQGLNFPLSVNEDFEFEATIDVPSFRYKTGLDLSQLNDMSSITLKFSTPYQEQIRKHKKKRINKKWAKRYGYRTVSRVVQLEDAQIRQVDKYEYEVLGDPCKFVKPY